MKKIIGSLFLLTVIISLGFFMINNADKDGTSSKAAKEQESAFEFSLSYNVGGKDYINTFDNELTVDTVEGLITIDFTLTKDEKERIKDKFLELNILDEDYSELPNSNRQDNTKGIYELLIKDKDIDFKFYWTSNYYPPIESLVITDNNEDRYSGEFGKLNKLWDLKIYITEIIFERDEYKALPSHKMYL